MASVAKYADLRAETSSAFEKLGTFLADLCEGTEVHQDSLGRPNLDTSLGSFYETFTALKARHADQNLTVAVLALTKSGKSTLLNALIGASCLPANNVPETARITRVTHTKGQAELVDNTSGQSKSIIGEEDIRAYLQFLNSEIRMRDHQLSDETYLDLKIPIAALKAYDDEAIARDVTIRLLDTPGPNEAGEVALKAQVERLLDSVDAVIYLLDYTKLKTSDEAEILQRLKEINPQLMARLSQRLFFVVNKADMIETSEGLDAEATKQYVASLITNQMQDESFQLKSDQVLLVSAQQALLSRLVLQGKADKSDAMRFGRLAFGSRAVKFSLQEHMAAAVEMLTDSGLAELEETVLAFLYAHSGSLKLLALLDDIVRMLQQIKNVAAASNAALQHDVASLQKETQELQTKLEKSLQSFDTVQQEAQAVEGEVVDEVQQRMQRLKEKLFRDVTNVLEPSRQHPPGRWQEAWHRAGRFLNRRPGHSQAQELELQNKLYELHAAISSSIEAEVRDFWQDVEAATNERQRDMFQCINRQLESLSRQIEATVGEALDLRLEPVTIAMDPPAAQDFHDSLQNLFAQGIRQRSVTRNRRRQQAYTVWEPRFQNGLCRTGQYFVGRPASRHVTEQYEQPVYELQPQHIKEYFIALVDGTIEASVKYVREYVHAYLSDMLEEARGQIHGYGQSFTATMQAALTTSQQGEEARSAALQVTTARLASTNSLLRDVAAIRRHAEQLCPGQHPLTDVMSDFSLDEPESSSHAEHDETDSNHAESSRGVTAVTDTGSKGKEVSGAMSAGFDFTAVVRSASGAKPAAYESLLATTHSRPQAAVPTSAHAEHNETDSNHAESSRGVTAVTDTGSKGKEVSGAMSAGFDFTALVRSASGAKPAAYESLLATTHSRPQAAVPTSAHAPRPYMPMDYSRFDKLLDSDSEESEHAYTPAESGLCSAPYGTADLEPEPGCAGVPCQERVEAAAAAAAHAESNMPSQESEESPLPGIMSELQQAMTDSISSSGCGDETADGIPLDEQTEMELALFMSLQNQEHVQARAAAESETESAESMSESESESESEISDSREAESAESESTEASSEAESVVMSAAAHAESAAMAAAAQAESAAMAAAAQAESAAMAAAAQAESAANAAVAQAESAATAAAAHATAAANTVAAHMEAAARSVDAALNHQAASVRGTVLSFADTWWGRRARPQQRGPQQEDQQHRGPQPSSLHHRGPQHAEVQQRGPQQVGVQQRGPQPGGQAAHGPAPVPGGSAMTDDSGSAALSVAASDPVHQEEEVAEVADSPEQVPSAAADATPTAMRLHSVSSDDSSFGAHAAPAPALPIDQFAALSLLDFDSVVPTFEDLDTPAVHDAEASPFDVHSEDQEGTASSHISIGHADQARTGTGVVVPVIPWDATNADQDARHNAEQVQDDAPVSYPRIDTSPFSASSVGSESPVHYPRVHMPAFQHPSSDSGHQAHQSSSPRNVDHAEPHSPRTQMHLSALGSRAFSCHSSVSEDAAQGAIGVHEDGDMIPAWGSAAWPLDVEEAEESAEAAASIHVHQEHQEIGRLAALSGHAEMSQDSDEWELVSSDLDEELA